ncbi:MAG: hypothetical protein ABIQ18_33350 [Umezawaea sp.]
MSTSPTEVSNASSTRARLIADAGRTPVTVNRSNSSRSRTVNVTGGFISDTTTILARQDKDLPGNSLPITHTHHN